MESPFKGKTGLVRIWNAFNYSLAGLSAAFRLEDAFRQEVLMALVLLPIALFYPHSGLEKALLIASVLLVLIVELLNSAVEAVVDRVSLERQARQGYRQCRRADHPDQSGCGVGNDFLRLTRLRHGPRRVLWERRPRREAECRDVDVAPTALLGSSPGFTAEAAHAAAVSSQPCHTGGAASRAGRLR